jgi:diaminohydroxyphosphoribosylaminopyrimidine deaminase/5-amino-6-(5-phosphoribosylamino)uracil reductase
VAIAQALRRFGSKGLRGASIAVTLEPCCVVGRTGPCTAAIIDAGIRRVFVGHKDPHKTVSGRGLRKLRAAGIEVKLGVLEEECRAQHRGFVSVCERGRPFTMLKLAASLDGRIATASGESRWITGPEARAVVHRLRARVDAVLVGSGTALADDPVLTARRGTRIVHRPLRILIDSKLQVSKSAKLFRQGAERTWVVCGPRAAASRRRALEALGAKVLEVPLLRGKINLGRALSRIGKEGVTQLLVEGGGVLAAAFLRAHLVDELHWFVAPRLLGGDGRPSLGDLGLDSLLESPQLESQVSRVGRDLYIRGPIRDLAGGSRRVKRQGTKK